MKKTKSIISLVLCICMLLTMTFSVYAQENKNNQSLQPGWIKINDNDYENPTTGEYFKIRYNTSVCSKIGPESKRSSNSVSFDFKIRYSFTCPTKFLATGKSAYVNSYAYVEDTYGSAVGDRSYRYSVQVGSKKANFTTGRSYDRTLSGFRNGKSYKIEVSTLDSTDPDYVVGSITVD